MGTTSRHRQYILQGEAEPGFFAGALLPMAEPRHIVRALPATEQLSES